MISKYKNKKVVIDGYTFDSKREAARYLELCLLKRTRNISDLKLQVIFPLEVNGQRVCKYIADFQYRDTSTGRYIVEDVKGVKTPVYRIKKKLMKALYNVEVQET